MTERKKYTPKQALLKIQHYCAYQDRCHQDVNKKLYDWGLNRDERDEIIVALIEENFLNEERFARSFARGKFRIKSWGKQKIRYELLSKGIGEKLIQIALTEISEEEYLVCLKKELKKKADKINDRNKFSARQKLATYLFNRGFEPELVWDEIKKAAL